MSVERAPIVLTTRHAAIAVAALLLWFIGDAFWLSLVDTSVLDCLSGEGIGWRSGAGEALICHPRLIGEGPLGWVALAWIWAPFIALALWLRKRRR